MLARLGFGDGGADGSPTSPWMNVARYIGLMFVDAIALFLFYRLAQDGQWSLAIAIAIITIFVNIINLAPNLMPLRWISPSLALMALMVLFPIVYTVYVAFTNYSTKGHLLTKEQLIQVKSRETFLPEGGTEYEWFGYRDEAGEYALWLTDENGDTFFVEQGTTLEAVTPFESGEGDYDEAGLPASLNGYDRLEPSDRFRALADVTDLTFGTEDAPIGVAGRASAGAFEQRFVYDAENDVLVDRQDGLTYIPDYSIGEFRTEDGIDLGAGFWVNIGFQNFARFFEETEVSLPLIRIFVWTVVFAALSVLSTFILGLFFALLFEAGVPYAKVLRTLLIIPYAIPVLISVATWRGMLNPTLGVLDNAIEGMLGWSPQFLIDPTWAKVAVLMVNLWLGYPYFMLVCSGALAAIPSDMYEAADVDGASWWNKFRSLTLPMLLVAVGPLLIASFTFNFNNFVVVDALTEGGPPMVDSGLLPAGHTDILISYAYRLAFQPAGTQDFGLASAITIVIFAMVAGVTLLQFRFTKGLEEISENA